MSVVHEGVPNGEKIMQLFGGDAKKKVFLYWSPGNEVIGMSKMDQVYLIIKPSRHTSCV